MALDPILAKDIASRIEDSLWAHGHIDPNAYTRAQAPRSMNQLPETLRLLVELHKALSDHAEGRKP